MTGLGADVPVGGKGAAMIDAKGFTTLTEGTGTATVEGTDAAVDAKGFGANGL